MRKEQKEEKKEGQGIRSLSTLKLKDMQIDYFEFLILVDSSWHSGTILRHSVLLKAMDVWYHEMTDNDRARAFEYVTRTQKVENETHRRFLARFDPDNQYDVTSEGKGIKGTKRCYLFEGKYWDTVNSFAGEEWIKKVEKVKSIE